jgi:CheY-like chemotaxis protein
MHQILSNLVGNAVKFTPAQGRVHLQIQFHDSDIEFRVADTGPGIESKDLDKIFEKYWQTTTAQRQGLGLGLAIAKDLVKAHGGKIWVESARGYGTTFGFHIPCRWQSIGVPEPRAIREKARWICLVDDDDDLREIMEENLRKLGYRVTAYGTGQTVLQALKEKTQLPDLMILDYRLPDMNGGDVLDLMRPRLEGQEMPVIFLSAEANLSHLADYHRATAFMTKPLRIRDLSTAIDQLI